MTTSQKSITSFFKKRPADAAENSDPNAQTPEKRQKIGGNEYDLNSPLSSAQKERMQVNASKAQFLKRLPGALHQNIGPTWFMALKPEFEKESFADLSTFLQKERQTKTIYPPPNQVWTWTRHFAVKETKVVILGQDPYHGPNQAHGLCFSVQKGVATPPSLVNMYKELEGDIDGFRNPGHGELLGWAQQGVLLLNACLTVEKGKANAHRDRGWEKITDAAVRAVSEKCAPGVVFLLWGAFAGKKAALVDAKKHHVLKGPHPSPLSAHRGFFGCKHFSKCNELLKKSGREIIDWNSI